MNAQDIAVDLIRIDMNTQKRLEFHEEDVEDYADMLKNAKDSWPFPPLVVFWDGIQYILVDGFHRLRGAKKAKRKVVPCIVKEGSVRDANLYAMGCNQKNGRRMSRAALHACVIECLRDYPEMTRQEIADATCLTSRSVTRITSEWKAEQSYVPPDGGTTMSPPKQGNWSPPNKPARRYDRETWFKRWEGAFGVTVRMIDQMAGDIEEKDSPHLEVIEEHLNFVAEEIQTWLLQD